MKIEKLDNIDEVNTANNGRERENITTVQYLIGETLQKLTEMCKGAIYLKINVHKNRDEEIEYYIDSNLTTPKCAYDIITNEIINKDNIVELEFYPYEHGFSRGRHYVRAASLEGVCEEVEKIMKDIEDED